MATYVDTVTINPDLPIPPWKQLAAILRERITSGELTGRLPGEKHLMQEYGLAMGTVRKAVKQLRDDGLIQTTPGMGSYVVPADSAGQ
ncbi:MAG TPA: winged helix-turn-helix domain-containing protein [Streptosporangiaceae bacterium]|nr:winged helix-turn-helix domain-containing protein [Streptosporangiaceae bacterium]